MRALPVSMPLLTMALLASPARPGEVAYSFRDGDAGGVAIVQVDEASGRITAHRTLFVDEGAAQAKKVRFSADGARVVLTSESEEEPYALLASVEEPGEVEEVELPKVPDEVRAYDKFFVATCDKGRVALFRADDGEVEEKWNGRKKLDPEGHKPEDVRILPDEGLAVVSFQKDNRSGKRKGNRLVLLTLPDLELVADIELPRSHPELHLPGNQKEQGPSPEALVVSPETDTLLVTLDLYGAVAMMDLSGARRGDAASLAYLPVSLDGSWGTAFPDRVTGIRRGGESLALVVNAGLAGGAHLVDLSARSVARRFEVPPGLEEPVWLESLGVLASVCSGKTKRREGATLTKKYHPGRELFLFELGDGPASDAKLRRHELGARTFGLAAVNAATSPLLLVLAGEEAATELLVVRATDGEVLDRRPAEGMAQRAVSR